MTEKMGTILWTRDINLLTGLSKLSIPPDAIEMKSNSMLIAVSVHSMVVSPISRRTRFTMRTMYPSCFWRPEQIQTFIRNHMGPTFERRHLRVDIILGTFRNDNFKTYPEKVLSDPRASKYVSIVGYQWEGLKAVDPTRRKYPEKSIMQTETDAGNWPWREDVFNPQRPPNDWSYGSHTWNKIREYELRY